ncbi:MAG: NAD(+)/NADH kinase [Chloroflexi bacterium]|nr:NAD(+)/NADH kinase [Chloroflexota bacterium]
MNTALPVLANVAVLAHPGLPEAVEQARRVAVFLEGCGRQASAGSLDDPVLRQRIAAGDFNLVVTLGGDGTVLRAGHLCAPLGLPILPVNFGHFGFLIEVHRDDWQSALESLLAGNYWLEERLMLQARHHRGSQPLGEWEVVNDVVIGRGRQVRPLHVAASLDEQPLTTYVADALIAATPTGSTAYALAAGGPILPPELRNILLVPVAPHLSIDRAIVLSEGAVLSLTLLSSQPAVLSVDGQPSVDLEEHDCIEVTVSKNALRLVRFQEAGYFYRNLISLMDQNPSVGEAK